MDAVQEFKVCVVDDCIDEATVLCEGLKLHGYEAVMVHTGKDAVERVSQGDIHLVLLDVGLPDIEGYEVCQRLKANPATSRIPVIFVTARGDTEDESRGFAVGAVDYIAKPISAAIVRARVATHVALHDQHRDLEDKVRRRTAELEETRLEIIRRLGRAAEYRDNETGMHVIRMSHYCRLLALAAGRSEAEADLALHATPMHDVGKIGIPDHILLKPGPLDDTERTTMRLHCAYGRNIIGDHPAPLLRLAATVALEHHERWDGAGYPRGLAGDAINPYARIVSVADVFDALTSRRPYKEPWPVDRAVDLLQREAGRHFDPDLVRGFVQILPDALEVRARFGD